METLENFYYLKVINSRNGDRGYICEKDGKVLIADIFKYDIVQKFKTYQDAQKYMREKKIERGGITAHIRDLDDLKKEGLISTSKDDFFTVVSDKGEKIFFDNFKQEYYFDDKPVGYCIWKSEKDVEKFIASYEFPCEVKCLKVETT